MSAPPSVVEPSALSPEDQLAASLEAMRKAIREKAEADNAALREEITSAEKRLKEATALAQKLGVTSAVAELVEKMKHWHAWSKNERYDFVKEQLVDGLAYLGGESTKMGNGNHTSWNEFIFKNKYRLSVDDEHWGYDSTDKYASIVVELYSDDNREIVFKSDVVQNGAQDFALWRPLHVTTLSVGDWLQDIVMLHEMMRNRQERQRLEANARYILPKAEGLPPE